jgi:hypothetical protein
MQISAPSSINSLELQFWASSSINTLELQFFFLESRIEEYLSHCYASKQGEIDISLFCFNTIQTIEQLQNTSLDAKQFCKVIIPGLHVWNHRRRCFTQKELAQWDQSCAYIARECEYLIKKITSRSTNRLAFWL